MKRFVALLLFVVLILVAGCGTTPEPEVVSHPFDTTNLSAHEIDTLALIYGADTLEEAVYIAITNRAGGRDDIILDEISANEATGSVSIHYNRDMYVSASRTLQTMLEETRLVLSRLQIREDVQEVSFFWDLPFRDTQGNEFYEHALMLRYERGTLDNVRFRGVLTVTDDMIEHADEYFMHDIFRRALDSE